MKDDGASRAIATEHQGPRIVPENRPWDSTKMLKGGRDSLPPIILALGEKGFTKSRRE